MMRGITPPRVSDTESRFMYDASSAGTMAGAIIATDVGMWNNVILMMIAVGIFMGTHSLASLIRILSD